MIAALSNWTIALADHWPSPGQSKIVSVGTPPPGRPPEDRPMTVVVGIIAFRRACFRTTTFSLSPFDRAVLMYSWFSTSSMLDRIIRVMTAIVTKDRVIAGRTRWLTASRSPSQLSARIESMTYRFVIEGTGAPGTPYIVGLLRADTGNSATPISRIGM